MGASPDARRFVLLGAGLGLGLAVLETLSPRGWWGGVAALVSLVPIALAWALGGPLAAAAATAAALASVGLARGGAAAAVLSLKCILPGAVLGLSLGARRSVVVTTLLTATASLLGVGLLLWLLAPAGLTPLGYLDQQLRAQMAELEGWPSRVGAAGGEEVAWAAEAARMVVATLRLAGPGMIAVGVFAGAMANYLIARLFLRRAAGFRAFAEEAVPDHFVWPVIAAGLLLVTRHEGLTTLGLNLLLVLTPLYAIQGLAVFRHFFLRVGVPRLLQVISFGLFAVQPVLLVAVACVGLSDLWVDFRKIRQAPTAAPP